MILVGNAVNERRDLDQVGNDIRFCFSGQLMAVDDKGGDGLYLILRCGVDVLFTEGEEQAERIGIFVNVADKRILMVLFPETLITAIPDIPGPVDKA